MLWKMLCYTLQSIGHTNHKFPVCATRNVQTPEINYLSFAYIARLFDLLVFVLALDLFLLL